MIPIGCQYFYHSSFFVMLWLAYSCGVLSAIHLDLGCTQKRIWSMLEHDWPPKSSSFHKCDCTSVTALYRVQCGSFNHNPLEEVARVRYTCSVIANRAGAWNSSFTISVCYTYYMFCYCIVECHVHKLSKLLWLYNGKYYNIIAQQQWSAIISLILTIKIIRSYRSLHSLGGKKWIILHLCLFILKYEANVGSQ